MSKGFGLKDPMPPLAVRRSLAISCYRDIIHKYGPLNTPDVILQRFKHLMSGGARASYGSFKAEDTFLTGL